MTGARASHGETARERELRARIDQLESKLIIARCYARRLWSLLSAERRGQEFADLTIEGVEVVDPVWAAAAAIFDRHRIYVEPCRATIRDQSEMFLAIYPEGARRNLTRDQLLMMGGQPIEAGFA